VPPEDASKNSDGCFAISGLIAVIIAVLLFIGITADPTNNDAEKIPTMPGATL
jgi:hypothetical protein